MILREAARQSWPEYPLTALSAVKPKEPTVIRGRENVNMIVTVRHQLSYSALYPPIISSRSNSVKAYYEEQSRCREQRRCIRIQAGDANVHCEQSANFSEDTVFKTINS